MIHFVKSPVHWQAAMVHMEYVPGLHMHYVHAHLQKFTLSTESCRQICM